MRLAFWKNPRNFDEWTSPYDPSDPFSAHFDNAFPGRTLLQVLQQGGGGPNNLGRQTVAALLNAANPDVDYPFTPEQVISMFNDTFPGSQSDYSELRDVFEEANDGDCPLDTSDDEITMAP